MRTPTRKSATRCWRGTWMIALVTASSNICKLPGARNASDEDRNRSRSMNTRMRTVTGVRLGLNTPMK
jgi:hypothetical protein